MVQALAVHSSIQGVLPQGLRVIDRPWLLFRLEEIVLFTDILLCQFFNDLVPILVSDQQTFLLLLYYHFLLILFLCQHFFLPLGAVVDRSQVDPEGLILIFFLLAQRRQGLPGVGSHQLRHGAFLRILLRCLTFHRMLLLCLVFLFFIMVQLHIHKRFLLLRLFPPALVDVLEFAVELDDRRKDGEQLIIILQGCYFPCTLVLLFTDYGVVQLVLAAAFGIEIAVATHHAFLKLAYVIIPVWEDHCSLPRKQASTEVAVKDLIFGYQDAESIRHFFVFAAVVNPERRLHLREEVRQKLLAESSMQQVYQLLAIEASLKGELAVSDSPLH